jgi:hypothetical protein
MGFASVRLCSSTASLTRCASPPGSVVAGRPGFTWPIPTSWSVLRCREMIACSAKKSRLPSMDMPSTSAMDLP